MLKMLLSVWENIRETIGTLPPEQGGILGGTFDTVTKFYFDSDAKSDSAHYYPCAKQLNFVLEDWHQAGTQFLGIIHSHQYGDMRLSAQDIAVAREIINRNSAICDHLFFPIVSSEFDSNAFTGMVYRISSDSIDKEMLYIIKDKQEEKNYGTTRAERNH